MIKKYVILVLIIQVSSLYAILGGIGIDVIQDGYSINEVNYTVNGMDELGTITRSSVNSPVGVGVFAYLTAIPFIDLEARGNFMASSYEYSYTGSDITGGLDPIEPAVIPFATVGWSVSVQKKIFKFPTIRLLVGGGINGTSYAKVLTPEVVAVLDPDQMDEPDYIIENLINDTPATGYHLEVRGRIKPPIIPFSVNANIRYNIVSDFLDGVDGYLSMSAGLAFAI